MKRFLINNILKPIEEAGFQAFFVGGCVRDALLKKEPHDFDITTSAKPEDLHKIFKRFSNVSKNSEQFGVTIILLEFQGKVQEFEIATFRKDVTKGRHPVVSLDSSLEEDAARRDFTINALFEDSNGNIIDPTGFGLGDLQNRTLRFVGNARNRMIEDPLRVFRFVRFMSQKGFEPFDPNGRLADFTKLLNFSEVSKERILKEFRQILSGDFFNWPSKSFDFAESMGVFSITGLQKIFNEMKLVPQSWKWHMEGATVISHGDMFKVTEAQDLSDCKLLEHGNVLDHTLLVMQKMKDIFAGKVGQDVLKELEIDESFFTEDKKFLLTLACILHDIGKVHCEHLGTKTHTLQVRDETVTETVPDVNDHHNVGIPFAEEFCKNLKLSNKETHMICSIVAHHMEAHNLKEKSTDLKKWEFVTHPFFKEIMLVALADDLGSICFVEQDRPTVMENLTDESIKEIRSRGPLPEPVLTGQDLIAEGFKPGEKFKKALDSAFKVQVNSKVVDKAVLLNSVRNLLK